MERLLELEKRCVNHVLQACTAQTHPLMMVVRSRALRASTHSAVAVCVWSVAQDGSARKQTALGTHLVLVEHMPLQEALRARCVLLGLRAQAPTHLSSNRVRVAHTLQGSSRNVLCVLQVSNARILTELVFLRARLERIRQEGRRPVRSALRGLPARRFTTTSRRPALLGTTQR